MIIISDMKHKLEKLDRIHLSMFIACQLHLGGDKGPIIFENASYLQNFETQT